MQDNIKFIAILIMLSLVLWFLERMLYALKQTLVIFERLESTINFTLESDYKTIEKNAETALAEEFETDKEESLYKNKDGTYSYLAYADNKKKRDANKLKADYIDDFEWAADEQERNKVNGR